MSNHAINWAFQTPLASSSMKFVLVTLADNADSEGKAWPCTETISFKTALDRKTVVAAIDRLESMKLIADSGDRKGRTGQVKVYQLACGPEKRNHPKNGTVSEKTPEIGTLSDSKAPVFPVKGSQKREGEGSQKRDTEPLLNPQGTRTPVRDVISEVNELHGILCQMYQRPNGKRMNFQEEGATTQIVSQGNWRAELAVIQDYRQRLPARDRRFFPNSIYALLSKWDDLLDRARVYEPDPKGQSLAANQADAFIRRMEREMQ
jgi:Helix-turn-helix domain